MVKYSSKIGDVYCVKLENNKKKYFQYIANDMTQLNSSVIRAFKKFYSKDEMPIIEEIVNDKVDFYAHTIIRIGVKLKLWEKVGSSHYNIDKIDILFRDTNDFGNSSITISSNWWIWEISGPEKYVGKLEGDYQKAEVGMVFAAPKIIERMQTGKYPDIYPGF